MTWSIFINECRQEGNIRQSFVLSKLEVCLLIIQPQGGIIQLLSDDDMQCQWN